MTNFYQSSMRCAAAILFVVAIVMILMGLLPVLIAIQSMAHTLGPPEGFDRLMAAETFARCFQSAVWPFFGAGLLWRIDRHWGGQVKAPQ